MAFSKEEINKRIRYVVSLSKEIPYYARKYKELGINPDEIRKPEDLLKAYEKGLYTTPADLPELVYYKHPEAKGPFYTSGTTGKPKEIWTNPDDEKHYIAQCAKLFKTAFVAGDRILNCFPEMPALSGHGLSTALSVLGYNFVHFSAQRIAKDTQKFIETLTKVKLTGLMGLTTLMYRLPLILRSFNITPENLEVKTVITSGEPSSIERRKTIGKEFGSANVYDFYGTTENYVVAYESKSFTDEHFVTLPETLLFVCDEEKNLMSDGEIGDVLITNLHEEGSKPWSVLLNYKIGDWARCVEKEDSGIVTSISEIRREAAYLAGAKLNPQEVEKCLEELTEFREKLSGEYCIINYYDDERKAVGEIRVESRKPLTIEEKKIIIERLKDRIYSSNIPVKTLVEVVKDAKLLIEITNPGELYKGYEQHIKPGKPKRLITIS